MTLHLTQLDATWFTGRDGQPPRSALRDPITLHRHIMRLFGDLADAPRSDANILFRYDRLPASHSVLMQSTIAPAQLPPQARTRSYDPTPIPSGAAVRFRVALNPIVRHDGKETLVRAGEATAALAVRRLDGALRDISVVTNERDTYIARGDDPRPGRPKAITIATIDGAAVVDDPERLLHLITTGVGRAKSFGCGLLSVQRIGTTR